LSHLVDSHCHLDFPSLAEDLDGVMDRAAAYTAPIKHNATNVSDEEVRVIEIEYKK